MQRWLLSAPALLLPAANQLQLHVQLLNQRLVLLQLLHQHAMQLQLAVAMLIHVQRSPVQSCSLTSWPSIVLRRMLAALQQHQAAVAKLLQLQLLAAVATKLETID